MRYCNLNFTGFYDTAEQLFGKNLSESVENLDFKQVESIIDSCIKKISNILSIELPNDITDIQFINIDEYAAALQVIGQRKYILLLNNSKLKNTAGVENAVYHELCHLYQLNKLFDEKIIFYDYFRDTISATIGENTELAQKHLGENGGHTKYWQDLADKINEQIRPQKMASAYYQEDSFPTAKLSEDYVTIDFMGFYDIL